MPNHTCPKGAGLDRTCKACADWLYALVLRSRLDWLRAKSCDHAVTNPDCEHYS